MITVSIAPIRETILGSLKAAVERVLKEGRQSATSLGIQFDFRFGRMWIALNGDDDESYRCPFFEDFQERDWGFAAFMDLAELEAKLEQLECEEGVPKVTLTGGDDAVEMESIEDVCRHLYPLGVQWIQEWFCAQQANQWKPIWLLLNEVTSGNDDRIRVDQSRTLPPAIVEQEPFFPVQGAAPPKKGAKVFVISYARDRKYAGLWATNPRRGNWFVGQSLAHEYSAPIPAMLDPEGVRRGDVARFERSVAYRDSGANVAGIARFFDAEPQLEKLSLFEGEENWTVVHPLNPVSVLDQSRTLFEWNSQQKIFDRVKIAEFDPDALRQMGRSVFKLSETPHLGSYFLEDEEKPGFLSLCEKHGLRGLKFDMVWCEDLSGIIPRLDEFMDLIRFRLKRLTGSAAIKNWMEVECLLGMQKDIWRLGEFREVFNKSGAEAALQQVPGISNVIRSFRPYVEPVDFCGESKPVSNGALREFEGRFGGREILNEVRGLLCCHLSNALSSLREMEATNSGHHSVFGPTL